MNFRGYHFLTHAAEGFMDVQPVDGGLRVQAFAEAPPFYLRSAEAEVEAAHMWYRNYELAAERARGLDHEEDHLHAGTFHAELRAGESVTLVASTDAAAKLDGASAIEAHLARPRASRTVRAIPSPQGEWPAWIKQLILAADQFVMARPSPMFRRLFRGCWLPLVWRLGPRHHDRAAGIVAGHGPRGSCRSVLRSYARFVDRGMLPNRFPEAGEAPEYNTVDAALWFFEAARQYYAATRDLSLVREIFPAHGADH